MLSIDTFVQDFRYGARLLRRSPAFTVVAVLSLALGIGASAAVFGLADVVLLRQLPVPEPERLVGFRWVAGVRSPFNSLTGNSTRTETESTSTSFSLHAFNALRERGAPYADVFGFADLYRVNLGIGGSADIGSAHVVSGNYFAALGVTAAAGRVLGDSDDRLGAEPVAMISHALWQRRFGADTQVIGRPITLNGVPFTIVGVMPRGFRSTGQVTDAPEVIAPLALYGRLMRGVEPPDDPNFAWVLIMGRLKEGATAGGLRAPLDLVLRQTVAAARPDQRAADLQRLVVWPGARGQEEVRNGMIDLLSMMMLVVGVVLLAGCANVANLLLARGRARAHEIAVRAAVGAPRWRIVRQLVTEGALLAALGAAGGLLFARWLAAALLPALTRSSSVQTVDVAVDWRLVAFTALVAGLCTFVFALAPAVRASDVSPAGSLHDAGRGTVGRRGRLRFTAGLVAAQVALCLLLVTTAGLLVGSVRNLLREPLGFDASNLLIFRVDPTLNGYEGARLHGFYSSALERLRAIPGVRSATVLSHMLISGSMGTSRVFIPGTVVPDVNRIDDSQIAWRQAVDQQFFETLGIPLLKGRTFRVTDAAGAPPVAIINRRMAQQFFRDKDPIGERFSLSGRPGAPQYEIVGLSADAKYTSVRREPPNTVYLHYLQSPIAGMTLAVKTSGDALAIAPAARAAIAQIDPAVPAFDLRTQQMQVEQSLRMERLFARLATVLGTLVLALAAIGLYGVVAYSVERRTTEIGIRMALGAERAAVRRMVLRESVGLALIGVLVGIPVVIVATRLVRTLLFGVESTDPLTLIAATALMLLTATIAGYIPARRTSRVDPLTALRAE